MRDHHCGCNAWPQGKKVSCRSIDTTISFKPNRCMTASPAFPLTTKDVEPGEQVSCERLKTDSVQGRNDLKDNEREFRGRGGSFSCNTCVQKKVSKKKKKVWSSLISAEWIWTEKPLWCDRKMVELTTLAKRCEEKVEVEITNRKQRPDWENNCHAEYRELVWATGQSTQDEHYPFTQMWL